MTADLDIAFAMLNVSAAAVVAMRLEGPALQKQKQQAWFRLFCNGCINSSSSTG
jgi:hypothetical protein